MPKGSLCSAVRERHRPPPSRLQSEGTALPHTELRSDEMDPILQVSDLHLHFHDVHAVDGVSFTLDGQEILGIIGPNGAGKTSVLNCINGFYHPSAGRL